MQILWLFYTGIMGFDMNSLMPEKQINRRILKFLIYLFKLAFGDLYEEMLLFFDYIDSVVGNAAYILFWE